MNFSIAKYADEGKIRDATDAESRKRRFNIDVMSQKQFNIQYTQ